MDIVFELMRGGDGYDLLFVLVMFAMAAYAVVGEIKIHQADVKCECGKSVEFSLPVD